MEKKISVAMAVYNGEKYIKEQIDSILLQLSQYDELIISCDKSSDSTLKILENYSEDKRIKVIKGPSKGILENFANAIQNCNNEYIFLSDQDDIWLEEKVKSVLDVFEKTNAIVVLHDAKIADADLNILEDSFFEKRGCQKGILKNIVKNSYIGCCMAFKSELKSAILPIPKDIPMHDQWIGLLGEKFGNVEFLNKPLILYRRHGANLSAETHSGIITMIKWRISLIRNFFTRSRI